MKNPQTRRESSCNKNSRAFDLQEAAATAVVTQRRSSRGSDHHSDRSSGGSNRPASMFEPRDQNRHSNKVFETQEILDFINQENRYYLSLI